MERNQVTMIVVGVAALLGAVALGVVLSRPAGEEPKAGPNLEAKADPAAAAAADVKPPPPKQHSKRPIPEAPTPVSAYTTTDSGLQYADITVGDGAQPQDGDLVSVEYTGWLEDGRMFDSSYKRADAFVFPLGKRNVIRGWDEGVATMKVGGKRQLKVPPELAYGPRARGIIPPNATLIFDVELKGIKPPRKVPAAPAKITGAYTKTPSGLEYFDFAVGDGAQPAKGQMVHVEYSGWLENGTLFDSSYKRTEALSFPIGLGKVIPGWDEGVGSMKVGGRRQLKIPPQLGYGDRESGPIPANSTLIFDVELVGVD